MSPIAQNKRNPEPPGEKYDLAVVMPMHNEAECIGAVVTAWRAVLGDLGIHFTIIVVDDGSTDETPSVLQGLCDGDTVQVVRQTNQGHGPAILHGYRLAAPQAQWVFQCDSDDEMPPESFGQLWAVRQCCDAVFGYRFGREQSLGRRIITACSRVTVRCLFGQGLRDVNAPYRLVRASVLETVLEHIPPDTFAPNVIMSGLLALGKARLEQVAVPHRQRRTGQVSLLKWKLWKGAWASFRQTIHCRRAAGAVRFEVECLPASSGQAQRKEAARIQAVAAKQTTRDTLQDSQTLVWVALMRTLHRLSTAMSNPPETSLLLRRRTAGGLAVLAGLIAAGLVLFSTSVYGVGVSPDSTVYLATAENLLSGNGYVSHDGTPFTAQPPLFPTLLAFFGLAGIEAGTAARFLNALATGATVAVAVAFMTRSIKSPVLVFAATLFVVSSWPLLAVGVKAWTEPVFILLGVLFLWQMTAFLRCPTFGALARGAVLAGLASIERHIGVTTILTGGIVMLVSSSPSRWVGRLKRFFWFSIISCALPGAWAVRSYRLTSTWSGSPRLASRYSLSENIQTAFDTLTGWFASADTGLSIRVAALAVILVATLATLFLYRHRTRETSGRNDVPLWPVGLFALVYSVLMTYTHQIGVLDETMNDRYMSPVFVPLIWLVFVGLDRVGVWFAEGSPAHKLSRPIAIGLCIVALSFPMSQARRFVDGCRDYGTGGYSSAAWHRSEVVQWLRDHRPAGHIYANLPDALYFLADIRATVSPHQSWDLMQFRDMIPSTPAAYLVWFDNSSGSYLYEPAALMSVLCLEPCATLSDGRIYRFVPWDERGGLGGRVLSHCAADGLWHRSFTSDALGPSGLIRSWYLEANGTTNSIWELRTETGTVITWQPDCPYEHAGSRFSFSCEGQAVESGTQRQWPYVLHVEGSADDLTAAGTYRIAFEDAPPGIPATDAGTWTIDLASPLFRLWSPTANRHLYVADEGRIAQLTAQGADSWILEGTAFHAFLPDRQPPDVRPVYELISAASNSRLYTIDEDERAAFVSDTSQDWRSESIAFYAYAEGSHPVDAKAVYRFWAPAAGDYFFTMDEAERDFLINEQAGVWTYEGIAWYALARQTPEP